MKVHVLKKLTRIGWKSLVCVMLLLLSSTSWAAPLPCWDADSKANVSGHYKVVEVQRYRGGLTPEEIAKRRVGEEIIVSPKRFSHWETRFTPSRIDYRCIPSQMPEGEVPPHQERYSNFYGLGLERELIRTVDIYAPSDSKQPAYRFEVVEGELWGFFDGWFYRMEKATNSSGTPSPTQKGGEDC